MMTRRLDEDDESILPPRTPRLSGERELTLGTGAILAIFFGLVLLCGAFFGFGYKLGSSTTKAAGAATTPDGTEPAAATSSTNFNAFKPNAGSPVGESGGSTAPGIAVRAGGTPVLTTPPGSPVPTRVSAAPASSTTDTEGSAPSTPVTLSRPTPPAPASNAPMPATSAGGTFVVQVAAVSHQEDADLLVTALHGKGYAVAARSESGDRLVHIQVGPFKDKKDADAMRQRLLADGYNAFIK